MKTATGRRDEEEPRHPDDVQFKRLRHLIGEEFRSFILVGFTFDDSGICIWETPSELHRMALTRLLQLRMKQEDIEAEESVYDRLEDQEDTE